MLPVEYLAAKILMAVNYCIGGVGVMLKGELCVNVVEVKRVSDRVMTVVVFFEEGVLRLICGYAPQSARSFGRKTVFL